MNRCVIGIDIGTSGCKTIAIDEKGAILASSTQTYPLYTPQPGWSEQDPADWWKGVCDSLKDVTAKLKDVEIAGVGFSGQMHGMVALDENNNVLRRAILWNDQRTQKQCDEVVEKTGGLNGLLKLTNNRMLTGYTGGKVLWMRENEPENYAKTKIILNPKDYIRFLLTGDFATEVSDASGTGFFNVAERKFSTELLQKLDIDPKLFPRCVESPEVTGTISAEAAKLTGLAQGTKVVGGGGDAVISTTGMGLVLPGKVGVTLGTSGVVAMGLDGFKVNPGGKLQVFCNNAPGTWHAMGVTLSAAGSYQWFRNTFGDYEAEQGEKLGKSPYDLLNEQAQSVPCGASGLIFLPYLSGERCPHADPNARGAFVGATNLHTKGAFARAVMEGVTMSLKQVFDLMRSMDASMKTDEVILAGGGTKSPLWRQIFADIFNLPVRTVYGSSEGGAFGAALVAGVGCGVWSNMESAMALASPELETYPIPENVEKYKKVFAAYEGLYSALKPTFDLLAEI